MKTASDPRHKKRQEIVGFLFSQSFTKQTIRDEKTNKILAKLDDIDSKIKFIAPDFPIEKINKIDLSILRLAVFELQFEKEAPSKVIIDEAIELAKEYGGDNSPSFINGALGKFLKS